MDTPKVIKNREEHSAALAAIDELLDLDPVEGSQEADRLELLAHLVSEYEDRTFPLAAPDPIAAIRFRMDQKGLLPRDLVPYLGSKARVSEILSGRRELTLAMIRALHAGLGIPIESLVGTNETPAYTETEFEWDRFPLREMVKRGWIRASTSEIREKAEELIRDFLGPLEPEMVGSALYRKSENVRSARQMDPFALTAWTARVLIRARDERTEVVYRPGTVTDSFMRDLVARSVYPDGPVRARDFLREHGIELVVEPHLPGTYLDGAALLDGDIAVIGMTIRYDRVDNFWFTLVHELVHIARHLQSSATGFYDDLEATAGADPRELEADRVASEMLIPESDWQGSAAQDYPIPGTIVDLARELGIHPAIVAGRAQHERKNFRLLHQMVGRGEIRKYFPDVTWN